MRLEAGPLGLNSCVPLAPLCPVLIRVALQPWVLFKRLRVELTHQRVVWGLKTNIESMWVFNLKRTLR